MPPVHARHTHTSASAENNPGTQSGAQDTGGTCTHAAHHTNTACNGTESSHQRPQPTEGRFARAEQAKTDPAPATEFRRPRHAIVRYSHHYMCVPLITGPVRAECGLNTSRPPTTTRSVEQQVHRTTTPDRPTEDPQRGQSSSRHTNYRDRAIEYSANATSTCRWTPSPDSTEYSTRNTVYIVYSTKLLPPARGPDTMNDPQQQQQQVTALTTEAVQSQDDHTRDEQRPKGSGNIPGTSDRPMTLSQTSAHSSIMDVDATNPKAPR